MALEYFLTAIVASLGILCGSIVGRISEEELKSGRKYLAVLQKAIVSLIVFFLVYQLNLNYAIIAAIASFGILFFIQNLRQDALHAVLGVLFYFSQGYIVPSLIFLQGFPAGSTYYANKKKFWIALIPTSIFIAVAIVLGVYRNI